MLCKSPIGLPSKFDAPVKKSKTRSCKFILYKQQKIEYIYTYKYNIT